MTMKMLYVGAHGRKPRYFIINDCGETVAYFDCFCTAGLVLRYLNGAEMSDEDTDFAWNAMRAFDSRKGAKRH
ncbi:MAG: hypothetical protein E7333_00260 [Clostridiales bacterium]|nr:hypothetical protein [Clostridiales bacterium]